jgi:hypothetical protein
VGAEGLKALVASCKSLQLLWADTPLLYKQQLLCTWLGEAAAAAGATAAEAARARDLKHYREDNDQRPWYRQDEEDGSDSEQDHCYPDAMSEDDHPTPGYSRCQTYFSCNQGTTKIACWLLSEGCRTFGLVALPTALDLQGALIKAGRDEGMVRLLVRAGVRVSNELLLSALHQRVQGMEVWVAAHVELGLATGLNPASAAVLLREDGEEGMLEEAGTAPDRSLLRTRVFEKMRYALWHSHYRPSSFEWEVARDFSQEMVWELLQLVSCQPHSLVYVFKLLQLPAADDIPTKDMQQLLLAAAVRSIEQGHTSNLYHLARALHLNARNSQAALAPLMQQLLDQALAAQDSGAVEVLLSLGASQLSSDQVFQLLLVMLQQRLNIRRVLGMHVGRVPEMVAQLTPDQVRQLLQQAAKPQSTRQLEALLKHLPAAADAFGDLESVVKILKVMNGRKLSKLRRSLRTILSSALAKDAVNTEAGAIAVLDACFRYGGRPGEAGTHEESNKEWDKLLELLREKLPAVEELSEAALLQLAKQLICSGYYRAMFGEVQCPPIQWLPALLQLPAGQGLSAASVGELVGMVAGVGGRGAKTCLELLMKHPAAKEVPGEELLGHLLAAAEEPASFVEELARVVGERAGVTVRRLEELMRSALANNGAFSGKITKLALLPAAKQLSPESLQQLLLEPVQVEWDVGDSPPCRFEPSDDNVCKHAAKVWLPLLRLKQAARQLPKEIVVGLVQRVLLLDCSYIWIWRRHSSSYEVLLEVLQLPWVAEQLSAEVWVQMGDIISSKQLKRDDYCIYRTDQHAEVYKAILELVGQHLSSEELLQLLLGRFAEGHAGGGSLKPALPEMVFELKGVQGLARERVDKLLGAALSYKRALQPGLLKLLVGKELVTDEQLRTWVQCALEQQYWGIGTLMQELQQQQQLKLPVGVAYQVLLQAIDGKVPEKYQGWGYMYRNECSGWKQVLEQQPALSPDQVKNLLHLVCAPSNGGGTNENLDLLPLLQLPAAQQVGVEEVIMVLQYLSSNKDDFWCEKSFWCVVLQHFSALQQLPLETVLQHLLWESGKASYHFREEDNLAGFSSWLSLPVMQQLTSEGAFQLLQAALGNTSALEALVMLPASQQVALPQVLALLQGAIQKKDKATFAILFKQLHAVKQLDVQQVHELLLLALRKNLSSIANVVVEQLPEACQEVSAEQVKGLLGVGLRYMMNPLAFLSLPAAADLPALELFHLLYMSARLGWGPLETLLKLPPAQQLDAEQVRCVLQAGLRAEDCDCSVALVLELVPAAKQLTAATCALLIPGLEKAAEKLHNLHCCSWQKVRNDKAKHQVLRLKSIADFLRDKMLNASEGLQRANQQRLGAIVKRVKQVEVNCQERYARGW